MKRRKKNIMLTWWPDDGWTEDSYGWILSSDKTFRTLKAARRHARHLLLSQHKDQVEFWRRVSGGWKQEAIWERTD